MSLKTVSKKPCSIIYCPNFNGTKDSSTLFIRAPPENTELRFKWYKSLTSNPGVQINPNFNTLCYLHFDSDDVKLVGVNADNNRPKYKLRGGSLPLPIVLPEQNKPPEHNVKLVDIDAIKYGGNSVEVKLEPMTDHEIQLNSVLPTTQTKGCGACAEYEIKLQAANAKIVTLQEKINEMKAEKLTTQLSSTTNKVMKDDEMSTFTKCSICWKRLEKCALVTHLCLELEFITCSYCTEPFDNTQSFVDHLDNHADEIRNNKTIYKCNKCPLDYPMPVLLDFHMMSHVRTIDPSAPKNMSNDSNKDGNMFEPIVSIAAIVDPITIKTEITDSTEEEEVPVQMIEPTLSTPASRISQSAVMEYKYFKCTKCGKSFHTSEDLSRHIRNNFGNCDVYTVASPKQRNTSAAIFSFRATSQSEKYFKCGKCEMSFELGRELSRHMQKPCDSYVAKPIPTMSSEEEPLNLDYNCGKCGITFPNPNLLSRHVQLYGCTGSFECYICHQTKYLKSIEAVHYHLKQYHSKYSNAIGAVRHHLKKHGKKWKKCKICKWRFEPNELDLHLCGNKKAIQCDYCEEEFTATIKLLEHLEKDHDKKRFIRCEKCSRFYPMQFLKDTCLASHVDIPKMYTCENCSKGFSSQKNLTAHMKNHTGNIEKPYLCELCGKGFSNERTLEIHKTTGFHREPTFQCPDCPKKVFSPGQLRRHSDLHQNNKYVCEICNLESISLVGYNHHMRRHRRTEADRRFACKLCPLKFFQSKNLKTHQAVHTGEKKFQCRFCDQAFKYNGDLNKHLRTHGHKIHACPQCPMRFEYKMELKRHSFVHHKEQKAREMNGDDRS